MSDQVQTVYMGVKVERRLPGSDIYIPLHHDSKLVMANDIESVKLQVNSHRASFYPVHKYAILKVEIANDGSFSNYEVIGNV